MPRYKVNNKVYNIPSDNSAAIDALASRYPKATVEIFDNDGNGYDLPLDKVDSFQKKFDKWSYDSAKEKSKEDTRVAQTQRDSVIQPSIQRDSVLRPLNDQSGMEMNTAAGQFDFDDEPVAGRSQQKSARRQAIANSKKYQERQAAQLRRQFEDSGALEQIAAIEKRAQDTLDENRVVPSTYNPLTGGGMLRLGNEVVNWAAGLFDKETRAARATKTKAEEVRDLIDEAGHADKGFLDKQVGGVFRGLKDGATRIGTWDFGATGIADAAELNSVYRKYQAGEELSSNEQDLLDMMGLAAAAQKGYGNQVGIGYNVGTSLPESAGFMASMAANPASGLAKKAVQKFGTTTAKRIAARVAGDIAEMGIMTVTTGAGRVAEDYFNRVNGSSTFDFDGNGIIRYGGQEEQEKAVSAIFKALGSQFIENYSEAVGEYFDPLKGFIDNAAVKGLKRMHLDGFAEALAEIKASQWSRAIDGFAERTKFNGTLGEYLEEVVGNIMNAATVGDMNFALPGREGYEQSVFNAETNLTTLLSCALMTGTINGVRAGGTYAERGRITNATRRADTAAENAWGEGWSELRDRIDTASPSGRVEILQETLNGVSNEKRGAVLDYAVRRTIEQEYNSRTASNRDEMSEEGRNAMSAYDNGYHRVNMRQMNDARNYFDVMRRKAAASGISDDVLAAIDDNPLSAVETVRMNQMGWSPEQTQTALDYIYALQTFNGMLQRVRDDIDGRIQQSDANVDSRTNRTTGMVQGVTMKDDRQVYVVSGNVVALDDGSINLAASDESIIIRDPQTGRLEQVSPQDMNGLLASMDPGQVKATTAEAIRQQLAQQAADNIDGKVAFQPGLQLQWTDDNGRTHTYTVVEDNGDDTIQVSEDGKNVTGLSRDYFQQQADAAGLQRAADYDAQNEAQRAQADAMAQQAAVEQKAPAYGKGDMITLRDENGGEVRGYIHSGMNEDGQYEVETESPINGMTVQMFTADQLNAMAMDHNGTPVVQGADNAAAIEQQTQQPVEIVPQASASGQIPTDENGQPDYVNAPSADVAWDALVEQSEGDTEIARAVADGMVAQARKALKETEKASMKNATTPAEMIAAQKAKKANVLAAQNAVRMWEDIASTTERRMKTEEEAVSKVDESRKNNGSEGAPGAIAETINNATEDVIESVRNNGHDASEEKVVENPLNQVPDVVDDTPEAARARGFRRVDGHRVDRQEQVPHLEGKEVGVKFSNKVIQNGRVAVIDASQLQPSHLQGQVNHVHFLDEAQPKDRADATSAMAAQRIARNIRPEEITSSVTAYTGAPSVNARGEVIQGNNRADALRYMWDSEKTQGEKYKQYLMDHAAEFGLNAEDVAAMEAPVLVNMFDVDDNTAIELGQYVASDTESGGVERIKPKNAAQKMGDDMRLFAEQLLDSAGDEDMSFAQLLDRNAYDVLHWMNQQGYISPTQFASAFDTKGNVTADAKNDLKAIIFQSIFKGGNRQLEEMFNRMPAKAQKAILATAYRDYASPSSESMIDELQDSIRAFDALMNEPLFQEAKNWKDAANAVDAWSIQYIFDDVTGESYLPSDKFSNFALHLATMYKAETQRKIQGVFNEIYDLVQGAKEDNLFEEADKTPRTLAEAISETLNIEYNGQRNGNVLGSTSQTGTERQPGGKRDNQPGERAQSGTGSADDSGRTSGSRRPGGETQKNQVSEENQVRFLDPRTMTEQEKQHRGEMLRNAPVTEVGVNVITSTPEMSARKAAEKWWDENVSEPAFYDTEVGEVEINRNTVQSSLAHRYGQKKLDAISSLIEGFENAVYLGTMPDSRERGVVDHYFAYPISYNGETNYVFCRAMQDGNKNRLYVHEVFLAGNIKKGDTLQTAASKPHGGISLYRDILANVLDSEFSLHPTTQIEESVPLNDSNKPTSTDSQPALLGVNSSELDSSKKTQDRHTTVEQSAETVEESQGTEQSSTQAPSSMNSPKSPKESQSSGSDGYLTETPSTEGLDLVPASESESSSGNKGSDSQSQNNTSEQKSDDDKHKIVSTARYEELKRRMREKLGQLNMGIDPEMMAIGAEMAVYHIEGGARKFVDYAKAMIADVGDAIRPYLKSFYNAVRDMPEAQDYAAELTPYEEVRAFNVATIGENGEDITPSLFDTAEQISNEETVRRDEAGMETTVSDETESNGAYTIAPAQYTKKNGDVLDMFLVTPASEMEKEAYKAASALARKMKGWYDSKAKGFMLRSEEDAKKFAEQTFTSPIGDTSTAEEIQGQRDATNTNPTEGQKEAGNYAKGHIKVDGHEITIENPKGSTRSGKDANGRAWSVKLNYDYGYIRRTKTVDGDHIDVYLSDNPASGNVYVVDQINQNDGSFDEHKVMYGFPSLETAREAYASQYEKGWKIGTITEVSREEFKKWIDSSFRKTKPFAEYKSVKTIIQAPQSYDDFINEINVREGKFPKDAEGIVTKFQKGSTRGPRKGDSAKVSAVLSGDDLYIKVAGVFGRELVIPDARRYGASDIAQRIEEGIAVSTDGALLAEDAVRELWKNSGLPQSSTFNNRPFLRPFTKQAAEEKANPTDKNRQYLSGLTDGTPFEIMEDTISDNEGTMDARLSINGEPTDLYAYDYEGSSMDDHSEGIQYRPSGITFEESETLADEYNLANGLETARSDSDAEGVFFSDASEALKFHNWLNQREAARKVLQKQASEKNSIQTTKRNSSSRKIDDYGEVIAGARKNALKEIAKGIGNITVETLITQPLGKVWKKPNLRKMVDGKAITEQEALYLEAIAQWVFAIKKPAMVRKGRWAMNQRAAEIKGWAESTYMKLSIFKQFVEGDDEKRKDMLAASETLSYPDTEAENSRVEEIRRLNEGRTEPEYEKRWGRCLTPDPVYVISEILRRMGYVAGDKVDYPVYNITPNTTFSTYYVRDNSGHVITEMPDTDSVEDAISAIVDLGKLHRGDADARIPEGMMRPRAITSKPQPTGKWRAISGGLYGTDREFNTKEEAEAYADKMKARGKTLLVSEVNQYVPDKWTVSFKDVDGTSYLFSEANYNRDTKTTEMTGETFDSLEEAQQAIRERSEELGNALVDIYRKKNAESGKDSEKKDPFQLYRFPGQGYSYAMPPSRSSNGDWEKISPAFPTIGAAKEWMKEHRGEAEKYLENSRKTKEGMRNKSFLTDETRKGEDYRKGKDVSPETFGKTFGFRGVQFGNWTNDNDRQAALNSAYDGLMDLSRILGISPKAISLNGELGIAFGARGTGWANAHYELNEVVINLTKTRGKGSLAHEWWHALDNYFARMGGMPMGMMTRDSQRSAILQKGIVREEMGRAYAEVVKAIEESTYGRRQLRNGKYWQDPVEMSARLLDGWVGLRLAREGNRNDFLCHAYDPALVDNYKETTYSLYKFLSDLRKEEPMSREEWDKRPESLGSYVNATQEELESLDKVMQSFFDTVQEKEGTDGNVMLFEPDGRTLAHYGRLQHLNKGEFSLVQREFSENGYFGFSGGRIESADDVAYILRNLEDKAVENAFAVLVKDGKPTVVHIGMGGFSSTNANLAAIRAAVDKFGADQVYFVHNHPSGNLVASTADMRMMRQVREMFGGKAHGIIIDTTSGKYGTFDESSATNGNFERATESKGEDIQIPVKEFDRLVFSKDYNVEELQQMNDPKKVAAFVSSQRLGERKKMGLLVLDHRLNIVGNFHLPFSGLADRQEALVNEFVRLAINGGGDSVIPYGNFSMDGLEGLNSSVRRLSGDTVHITDVISTETEGAYRSVAEGVILMEPNGDDRFRTSEELDAEFGKRWIEEQTNMADGRHTTQVKNTLNSYKKFADWVKKDSNGRNVSVLDASSGLGLGTQHMRENGLNADDVEPYASSEREAPNFSSYADIDKKYDYVISNAVLNVIPDDWRADVLHNMADVLKAGGKLVINVRSAKSIEQQGTEGKSRITLDSPSEILVTRPDGSIRAYQKVFTKEELRDWARRELGEGYEVEIANNANAGSSYDTAIVVTKIDTDVEELNNNFNENLQRQIDKELPAGFVYELGLPSAYLQSVSIERLPITLNASILNNKSNDPAHPYSLEEVKDLVKMIQKPIAIFQYGDKKDARNLMIGISQPGDEGKQFLVGLFIRPNVKGKGVLEINSIRNVFPKNYHDWIHWVNQGKMMRVDGKEEIQAIINALRINPVDYIDKKDLDSATKIIKDFENPSLPSENSADNARMGSSFGSRTRDTAVAKRRRVEELAKQLNLDNVVIRESVDGLEGKRRRAKGFYTRSTGNITIVLSNHSTVADVEQTLLHEAVAHYGLRQMFGKNFDNFLDNVFLNASLPVRQRIVSMASRNGWDFRTATEEYLAGLAENTNFEEAQNGGWWGKIKQMFLNMLDKLGFKGLNLGFRLRDNELRYILWGSYQNLKGGKYGNIFNEAADITKQMDLKVGEFEKDDTDPDGPDGDLFRDGEDYDRALARSQYEHRLSTGMYQAQEAMQDSMLGLRTGMAAILGKKRINIEDVDGFENAYLGENRLSSVNLDETNYAARTLFKPLFEEISRLAHNDTERADLKDYMMAKHGLERNEYMAQQEFEKYQQEHPDGAKTLEDFRKKDYAGLTALTEEDDTKIAEGIARDMVDSYEKNHDTTALWEKVNAISGAILRKSYESGFMNKETYDKISSMYEYYIPLRGFNEKTSEEAYAYLTSSRSAFNAPIKAARGRKSKADDPIATLQQMMESGIAQGNRNTLVKQKFLNFVLNHPSDLVSVSDLWIRKDEVTGEWVSVFPDNINADDPASEVERKMKEFEEKMQQLAEAEPDNYKKAKDDPSIPYRVVTSRELHEHQIVVKRNGKDIILTVNGNPRLAQALNGQTNPDNDISGAIGAILKGGQWLNRKLSSLYTTKNPDFVLSNFMRDMLYTNTMVWVKEKPNYSIRFHKNIGKVNPKTMFSLIRNYEKGTLGTSDPLEVMFRQFMQNGGETGYTSIRDIEQHKRDIEKEVRKANGEMTAARAWDYLEDKLDLFNRSVENCARFAAFVTSREMGRSIDRSIWDAKEVSVNFNKKGSGSKFMEANGQTKAGKASAFVSGLGRSGFVFWNASVQGLANIGDAFRRNPKKALGMSAALFALGAIIAYLGYDGDDEDENSSYFNLPEYVRRSNIMFRPGTETWVSLPLPIEYRAIYGMGELMTSALSGKEHFTDGELASAIASQVTQVLPLDVMEGNGGFHALIPSAIKPVSEALSNKSWTGMPIYKDTPYNKEDPEWTKAYKSANKEIVWATKGLNWLTGGDKYTKGWLDLNPAKIEYVLNGYFGGIYSTIDKMVKMAETATPARDFDPRNFILINRLVKSGDERTEYRALRNEFFRARDEHDKIGKRLRHYESDTDEGIFDYAEKIDFLHNSPEYARWEIFEEYKDEIKGLDDIMKEYLPGSDDYNMAVADYINLMKEMVARMDETRKRK